MPIRTLAAAVALALIAGGARAEPGFFRVDGLPRGDTLSIREAPEAEARAIGQIPDGARIRGFGCTADTPSGLTWCRVKSGPIVGWARRRYLAPD